MKKNIIRFFSLAFLFLFVSTIFSGCKEDDDKCNLIVIVYDQLDTSKRISNASINIYKDAGNIKRDGKTNENGEAYFTFDNEAIFDINVTSGTKTGKSTVRLKQGETVTKAVYIQ